MSFSPDGKRIVSGGGDGLVKVWDVQTGQETLTLKGHLDWVTSASFSPDGKRIVSGSYDKTLKVWDAAFRRADLGNALCVVWAYSIKSRLGML